MRVPPSMLAAIAILACLLCAHSAVGEDGDTSFCDTLYGMMNSTFSWDEEFRVGKHVVVRTMQPAKPPGAVRCVAYGYGYIEGDEGDASDDEMSSSILYTCQWRASNPRSTFIDFGTRLDACLVDDDSEFVFWDDQGDQFRSFWGSGNETPDIDLRAYKMSGKGVFLQ